jgi:hypothetical protein
VVVVDVVERVVLCDFELVSELLPTVVLLTGVLVEVRTTGVLLVGVCKTVRVVSAGTGETGVRVGGGRSEGNTMEKMSRKSYLSGGSKSYMG